MNSWASKYLGKKWVLGAKGPDVFDCWGLVHYIYKHHFGVNLPEYPAINVNTLSKVVRLINRGLQSDQWEKLATPEHGCAVGMSTNIKSMHHVGIYVAMDDGYVLHCATGKNVIAQPVNDLHRTGWKRVEYYKFRG